MDYFTLKAYLKIWMNDCLERGDLDGAILAWKEEGKRNEEAWLGPERRKEGEWRRENGRDEEQWVEKVWSMGKNRRADEYVHG